MAGAVLLDGDGGFADVGMRRPGRHGHALCLSRRRKGNRRVAAQYRQRPYPGADVVGPWRRRAGPEPLEGALCAVAAVVQDGPRPANRVLDQPAACADKTGLRVKVAGGAELCDESPVPPEQSGREGQRRACASALEISQRRRAGCPVYPGRESHTLCRIAGDAKPAQRR
ncbi:hypothetical protein G6F65_014795 [Rhizopus arrhizus]|nr:hypothetical protein G6F65_014795 [Rhizopus arrhizus]